jgi:hypothetical protein
MAEWVKAAEVQLEMHRFFDSEAGHAYIRGWTNASALHEDEKRAMYGLLMQTEAAKLLTADAIWVAPEICEIVQVAREGFKPEALEREDFLVPNGFVYFAQPLYMKDRHGMTCSLGAISWCPVFLKSQRDDTDDTEGMAITVYSSCFAEDDDFQHQHLRHRQEYGIELAPLHATVIAFGEPFDEGDLLDEHDQYTAADEWWKTVQATLRLMQQRLAIQVDTPLPRATRRRAERADHPIREMTLIRLRRATVKHGDEEGEGRHFTHRFLRDSHWRNQWYPSLSRHRQIWIHPTIVGDESLPLIVKKRYYKWDR